MEFKQLEAFVAVVDYGSFSEAARRLYLTQPTISAHIRSLEDELHMKLIIRTTKKTTITAKGYQLYDSAVRMLEIRNNLKIYRFVFFLFFAIQSPHFLFCIFTI